MNHFRRHTLLRLHFSKACNKLWTVAYPVAHQQLILWAFANPQGRQQMINLGRQVRQVIRMLKIN